MMEAEALTEALDDFGLDLDSPELEGMDGGDIWRHIDGLRSESENRSNEQKMGDEKIPPNKPATAD